ncbi:MAG: hypothetical protein N3F11_10320 [Casimicrobiaceae bacterium]|nr:hypothetical protein [Casimicrobiaceae bacterium]MDW8311965.1 hypothetical protein [Burkholderiales bacterium]
MKLGRLATLLVMLALVAGCQPSNPPPTALPTKEKTIDRVTTELDRAAKQAEERLKAADAPNPADKDPYK